MDTSSTGRQLGDLAGRSTLLAPSAFTLIELMVVVAIIGVLAAIAVPLYGGAQSRARTAKAHADVRILYAALEQYRALCGGYPGRPGDRCTGHPGYYMDAIWMVVYDPSTSPPTPVGPFLRGRPQPPSGWRDYVYHVYSDGTMVVATVASNGDNSGRFVTMPPNMENR